ncbi:hypothetical protein O6H91_15G028000 [Diphasiastrum complanatum]|nr:hypothetical protein O6H91_15G028000 [Diphasiastrum complanatum]
MASKGLLNDNTAAGVGVIDPEPHMSNQFYTFNRRSHHLMVQCILAGRHATAEEIQSVATPAVLTCWRSVWKDRHEGTAYLTGWKRIQDKLHAQVDEHGNEVLHFKNNPFQFVPFIEQWQDIVQTCHADTPDLKHLGHKEAIDRIRQVWTVGAKFYGIPESFVRVCITACAICGTAVDEGVIVSPLPKRRRFEYTESFEVLASEVPQKLQQLAAKYKVVLCIRQKYIRYKPFLAEVKDYCCHRGGEPTSRKPGVLKRKRYMSKRCGCSFRIRAIVPITNYDEKDKTFTYQEEGLATFKLHAIHSGHEPGPHEGSARIIHRFVDPASLTDELDALVEKEEIEARQTVLRRIHELQEEVDNMEQNVRSISVDVVAILCQELQSTSQKLRDLVSVEKLTGVPLVLPSSLDESISNVGLDHCDGGQNENYEGSEMVHHGGTSGTNQNDSYIQGRNAGGMHENNVERDVKTMKFSVCLPSCVHCGRKDMFGSGISELSCDCLVRQDGECDIGGVDARVDKDVSLVGIPVENYCTDNDKWYEGVSCSLDSTRECGVHLSHPSHLEFGHEIA